MINVYKTIRDIRTKKGYSQEFMADKLGMNQSSYGKLERGGTQLTIERLEQIADIFEIDIHELLPHPKSTSASRDKETVNQSDKVKLLEKRISELEDQLEDKKRIIRSIKENFDLIVSGLDLFVIQKYGVPVGSLEEAKEYAAKYNHPEALEEFIETEKTFTQDERDNYFGGLYFMPPERQKKANELFFKKLHQFKFMLTLGLIDEDLESRHNLTVRWREYLRKYYSSAKQKKYYEEVRRLREEAEKYDELKAAKKQDETDNKKS
jgi:transcriptional regulator with XRE-family HTH domain